MAEPILYYVLAFLGGIVLWSVKGYLSEKTKNRRANDQSITLGELKDHCRREHDKERKTANTEVEHLKEMIDKDLAHGRGRFEMMETQLIKQNKMLICINKSLALLKQAFENKLKISKKELEISKEELDGTEII